MSAYKLPDEILLLIAYYLAARSTHSLRNFALVGRKWYLIAAPVLLSTIVVSSLSDLVRLCDHIASAHETYTTHLSRRPSATRHPVVSMIAHHIRTIVISGTCWPRNLDLGADYRTGLDQYQPAGGEDVPPDVEIPYDDMISKLDASIPLLKQLKSLEWYGRFPGDYYLTAYLLEIKDLNRLTLCIDNRFVIPSQNYCNIALAFKQLTDITVETSCLSTSDKFLQPVLNMLRRNPSLERITLLISNEDILIQLVSDPASSDEPFTWPKLRRLELRATNIDFWIVAERSDIFARFLVAHPLLQTLILHSYGSPEAIKLPRSFSLAPWPHALPNLLTLRAPLVMIAGILESESATSSLVEITDSTMSLTPPADSEPLVERIMSSLQRVADSPLSRLKIQIPRFDLTMFIKLSKCTPNINVPELDQGTMDRQRHADRDAIGVMAVILPIGLSLFPKLQTIGNDIAICYNLACGLRSYHTSLCSSTVLLAEMVPSLRSVHIEEGVLFVIRDGPSGFNKLGTPSYLNNADMGSRVVGYNEVWKTRPKSRDVEEWHSRTVYADKYIITYMPGSDMRQPL